MNKLFKNFCQNSSLHGLHYLVNKRKTLVERVFWAVLMTIAIFLLVLHVIIQLNLFYSSALLAVVENPHYDLSAFEFPAVTVCPNINVMKSKVESLIKSSNISKKDHTSFRNSFIALSLMRFAHYNLPQDFVNAINGNVYPFKNYDISHLMVEVKPDLDTIMDSCTLKSKHIDCKKLFRPKLTVQGLCYSFNTGSKTTVRPLQHKKNVSSLGKSNNTLVGYRTSMFGIAFGLGFRLKSLANETLNNTLFGDYYSVDVHDPLFIQDMRKMFIIPSDEPFYRQRIVISVSTVEADDSVKNMNVSLRNCVFINQSDPLSCKLRCRILSILNHCHCIPYYLHHLVLESDVCGLEHLQCLSDLAVFFHTLGMPRGAPGFPEWIRSQDTNCSCLQPCSYIAYTSQLNKDYKQANNGGSGWTRVNIFYETFAVKYSRTASYLFRDLLVHFGGFASLLIGFSSIAVIDLVIYSIKLFAKVFIGLFKKRSDTKRKPKKNQLFITTPPKM